MIGNARVLGLVTARGGSKGLPGKNIRLANGRPLIDYTIAAGRAARTVDRLVLSTDDEAIAEVALRCGCEVPFMRPAELAADGTPSIEVVLHALQALPGFDIVVLLQPTSPAREGADIDATVERMVACAASSCVSVCAVQESPFWMYTQSAEGRLQPLLPGLSATRRQDLPAVFTLNGAVYAARVPHLQQTRSFVAADTVAHLMPRERSIDIDTLEDFDAFVRQQAGGT